MTDHGTERGSAKMASPDQEGRTYGAAGTFRQAPALVVPTASGRDQTPPKVQKFPGGVPDKDRDGGRPPLRLPGETGPK